MAFLARMSWDHTSTFATESVSGARCERAIGIALRNLLPEGLLRDKRTLDLTDEQGNVRRSGSGAISYRR